jgi:hypothetical protein
VWDFVQKTGTEDKFGRTVIKTESTEYEGASVALATSGAYISTNYRNNPNTGAAWTRAQVNAMQAGMKVKDT